MSHRQCELLQPTAAEPWIFTTMCGRDVLCFLQYMNKYSTLCLMPFLKGYECCRDPVALPLGLQIPSFGCPPSHHPGGPPVLSLSSAWSWWDFSVFPSISPAKHYKPALRCQQIYDIDLNLQDMKSKHWTVLFAFWFFLAFRVHVFNFSMQAWELETLIFTNWKLRYFSHKPMIPDAEGEAETCENIPKVLPVLLPSQPKQPSWVSEWAKGPVTSWKLNRAATSRLGVQETGLIQDCSSDIPDSRNPRSLTPSLQL